MEDLDEELYLDFTEKKIFVHIKQYAFKKLNSFKLFTYLNIPDKIKIGGNRLNLKNLLDYNLDAKKMTKNCEYCSTPLI